MTVLRWVLERSLILRYRFFPRLGFVMLEETADTALIPARWKVGGVFHRPFPFFLLFQHQYDTMCVGLQADLLSCNRDIRQNVRARSLPGYP